MVRNFKARLIAEKIPKIYIQALVIKFNFGI